MKKMKILRINFELRTDTRYVFNLNNRYSNIQVIAKNVSFRIRTNQFGLAMHCFDESKVKISHEKNWRKTYSAYRIISNDCKCVSINVFDNITQERIKSFLHLNIKKANANRTSAIVSTNNSKSPVNTLAKVSSKKKVGKMRFRSFVSAIALEFVKTKSRFNDLLNNREFSYKEFLTIYSKKFNEIYSLLT